MRIEDRMSTRPMKSPIEQLSLTHIYTRTNYIPIQGHKKALGQAVAAGRTTYDANEGETSATDGSQLPSCSLIVYSCPFVEAAAFVLSRLSVLRRNQYEC